MTGVGGQCRVARQAARSGRFTPGCTRLSKVRVAAGDRLRSTLGVRLRFAAAAVLFVTAAGAQNWELGGIAGYGFYHNGSITGASGTQQAGITDRIVAGGVICEDLFEHLSGEARYLYGGGHPFLSMPGFRTEMDGRTHTLTYDALFHLRERAQRLRPYLAAGIGGKGYEATGPGPSQRSAPQTGGLVHTTQWTVVADFGAGVKYRLNKNVVVRVEFRDYLSPLPDQLIVAPRNGSISGILHQFTPLAGLSYSF